MRGALKAFARPQANADLMRVGSGQVDALLLDNAPAVRLICQISASQNQLAEWRKRLETLRERVKTGREHQKRLAWPSRSHVNAKPVEVMTKGRATIQY